MTGQCRPRRGGGCRGPGRVARAPAPRRRSAACAGAPSAGRRHTIAQGHGLRPLRWPRARRCPLVYRGPAPLIPRMSPRGPGPGLLGLDAACLLAERKIRDTQPAGSAKSRHFDRLYGGPLDGPDEPDVLFTACPSDPPARGSDMAAGGGGGGSAGRAGRRQRRRLAPRAAAPRSCVGASCRAPKSPRAWTGGAHRP